MIDAPLSLLALAPSGWNVTADDLVRVLTLRDYNTRVVILGVMCLGAASGLIGVFLLLRRRALLGDTLSHATLPGIAGAFLLMSAFGSDPKWLPGLLAGGAVTGVLGMATVTAIVRFTRLKEDAALATVLSVYFGAGVALLSLVQSQASGHAAGLSSFIYGKTASMLFSDAVAMAATALVAALLCVLLFKEFTVLTYDMAYARAQGWPTTWLDALMMILAIAVVIVGLQAVGLILMVALLVIPPAAARFWSLSLSRLLAVSAVIGAVGGFVGAAVSALLPRMPAGALIVLAAAAVFGVSLLLGPQRGVLSRWRRYVALERLIERQHLLRAAYELSEMREPHLAHDFAFDELVARRAWRPTHVRSLLRRARREGLVDRVADRADERYRLTAAGAQAAWRVARNHRLWELYLIEYADVAASNVDRGADRVEHVLDPLMIRQLEERLVEHHPDLTRPPSPHTLAGGAV